MYREEEETGQTWQARSRKGERQWIEGGKVRKGKQARKVGKAQCRRQAQKEKSRKA